MIRVFFCLVFLLRNRTLSCFYLLGSVVLICRLFETKCLLWCCCKLIFQLARLLLFISCMLEGGNENEC
jgi:hypothetical protein